jgi:hypothetical protein
MGIVVLNLIIINNLKYFICHEYENKIIQTINKAIMKKQNNYYHHEEHHHANGFGNGHGQGRGQGLGRGLHHEESGHGNRNGGGGFGPTGQCICLKCGYKEDHKSGIKCTNLKCPECGHVMARKELVDQKRNKKK